MKPSAICSPTRKTAGWMLPFATAAADRDASRSYCGRCAKRGTCLCACVRGVIWCFSSRFTRPASSCCIGADSMAWRCRRRRRRRRHLRHNSSVPQPSRAGAPRRRRRRCRPRRSHRRRPQNRPSPPVPPPSSPLRRLQRAALRLGDGLRRLWRRRRAVHRAARGHACEEVAASAHPPERDATDDDLLARVLVSDEHSARLPPLLRGSCAMYWQR